MDSVKVPLKSAHHMKQFLIGLNIYDRTRIPKATKMHIYFPILSKENRILGQAAGASFSRIGLEQVHKNKYTELLKEKIPSNLMKEVPSSYDIIGDIILIDINEELEKYKTEIGKALLISHRSARTVLKKTGIHEGEYRTQKYECIAGIDKREAVYKENNVALNLDVEKVYFSPRLSTERKRIYLQVKKGETILVMFSGCAPYPIVISKNTQAKTIIGVEKNPIAHEYGLKNLCLNKIKNVELREGDVREIVPRLNQKFDRIIMPLPKDADTFLDVAFKVAKKNTIIHLYDFEHETEISKGKEKLKNACKKFNINYNLLGVVKCGQYSPGKFRICIDFEIL